MQLGTSMSYAAWHPIHVGRWYSAARAVFHAHIYIADALGKMLITRSHEMSNAATKNHSAYATRRLNCITPITVLSVEFPVSAPSTKRSKGTYRLELSKQQQNVTITKLGASDMEAQPGFNYIGAQCAIQNDRWKTK